MEALRGGAAGPSPASGVTAQRLDDHLQMRTPEIARSHGHDQTARVERNLKAGVNLIFGDYPAESNVIIAFVPPRPVPVILFGPRGEQIKAGMANTGPWPLNLTAGTYWLQEGLNQRDFRVGGVTGVQHVEF